MLRCRAEQPNGGSNSPVDEEFAHLHEEETRLLIAENEAMLAEIESLRKANATFGEQSAAYQAENASLKAEVAELRKRVATLQQSSADQEDCAAAAHERESRIEELSELLQRKETAADDMQAELDRLHGIVDELRRSDEVLEREKDELIALLDEQRALRTANNNEQILSLEQELGELRQQRTSEVKNFDLLSNMLRNAIAHAKHSRLDSTTQLNFLESAVQTKLKMVAATRARFVDPEKSLDHLRAFSQSAYAQTLHPAVCEVMRFACEAQWLCVKMAEALLMSNLSAPLSAVYSQAQTSFAGATGVPMTPRVSDTPRH